MSLHSDDNTESKKDADEMDQKDFPSLTKQVLEEFSLSRDFIRPKWDEWIVRLKLYNNQKRGAETVGDPLLFRIHQTILSSLYNDELQVDFLPRELGDEDMADNLTSLAAFDHAEMEKDELDYDWDWGATFYGHSLCMMMEWSKKLKVPMPECMDMMTFLRDPRAIEINGRGLKQRNSARFFGRVIRLTKREMEKNPQFKNFEGLKSSDSRSEFDQNRKLRADAQGVNALQKQLEGENKDFELLEWFTYWKEKRTLVTIPFSSKQQLGKEPIRFQVLENQKKWPVLDRVIYPMTDTWDGVSVADLVEDKQRARAVSLNLALFGMKSTQYPMYLFNKTKIKNKADLQLGFNKFIPIDGSVEGAIAEVPKQQIKQDVDYIMGVLEFSAQAATATPELQQGIQARSKRTATEISIQQNKIDTRFSLSARVFGWSEKRFWRQWLDMEKKHFTDVDKKIIRITGGAIDQIRTFERKDIFSKTDPDIVVESKAASDAKRLVELNTRQSFYAQIAQDPDVDRRFLQRSIARIVGIRKQEMNALFPKTGEEILAEQENVRLNKNQPVTITLDDDDRTHLKFHQKANQTKATELHIQAHIRNLKLKAGIREVEEREARRNGQLPAPPGAVPQPQATNPEAPFQQLNLPAPQTL